MKVAIMGAGLAGLTCAITLEQNGIEPVIFEKRRMPGDRFINGEAIFNVSDRPINNSLDFLKEKYSIELEPISRIREITLYSPNEKTILRGELGYTNYRGRHQNSFDNQLAKQVKTKILYNAEHEYEELVKEYSHVVLATGDAAYAEKLNNFRIDLKVNLRGAIVRGSFNTGRIASWYNNDFSPRGYSYLIPLSGREANISIGYPYYNETKDKNIETLWEKFYRRAQEDLGQELDIVDSFEIEHYLLGLCNKAKIGNTYFVGNNFGCVMPAYGLGQFAAMLTGIYAALDICGIEDYEKIVEPLKIAYENSLIIRRALEKLDNDKLDMMVKMLNTKLASKIFSDDTEFDLFKLASNLIRPFIDTKK